jgi:protein-disulfide isomerase
MRAPDLDALLRQDQQDAITLKVSQTPEFFVNGRPAAASAASPA